MDRNFWKKGAGIAVIVVALVLALSAGIYFKAGTNISGHALLDLYIQKIYQESSSIEGSLKLNVQQGELIPLNSKIIVNQNGRLSEFDLSDFVASNADGKFYVQGEQLEGSGEGFGFAGVRTLFPEVHFTLEITQEEEGVAPGNEDSEAIIGSNSSESDSSQDSSSGDLEAESETTLQEEAPAEILPEVEEETQTDNPTETPSESSTGITGNAVSSIVREAEGVASKDRSFSYKLGPGETASVKAGSVTSNGKTLDDSAVVLSRNGEELIGTTDYSVEEEGFGSEYVDGIKREIEISLSRLNISSESGELVVILDYDGDELARVEKRIDSGAVLDNTTQKGLAAISRIQEIAIGKNSNFSLDLSQYFSGAEKYLFVAENLKYNLDGDLLTIIPDTDFVGRNSVELTAFAGNDSAAQSFIVSVGETNYTLQTKKYKVVINRPVKWQKKISISGEQNVSLELPKEAQDISVKTGSEITLAEQAAQEEESEIGQDKGDLLTGKVSFEISSKRPGIFTLLWARFVRGITGRVVADISQGDAAQLTSVPEEEILSVTQLDNGVVVETDDKKVVSLEVSDEALVEFQTPGPSSEERIIPDGKRIIISAADELNYTDILAYTELNNSVSLNNKGSIKFYHVVEGKRVAEDFDAYDLDEDGNIDYIEWIVPHLSEQVYEIILDFDTSIVAWYQAENNAIDSSGNGNDGTLYGGSYDTGVVGQAFSFDGDEDYVEIPASPTFNYPDGYSVSLLFKLNSLSIQGLYGQVDGTGRYIDFYIYDNGGFKLRWETGSSQAVLSTTILQTGVWYHAVGVYNGTSGQGSLYINGSLENSAPLTSSIDFTDLPIKIGEFAGYTNGSIDEVLVFNRALTPEEIADMAVSYGLLDDPPVLEVSPSDGSTESGEETVFSVSANEALDWCGLSLDGGENISMTIDGSSATYTNSSMIRGDHTAVFSCNNSAGRMASETSSFSSASPLIVGCTEITESGEYSILNDIDATSYGDDCIVINADNVILNGNDNTITGDGNNNGIDVLGSDCSVSNIVITNVSNGIDAETGSSSDFSNIIVNESDYGLYIESNDNTFDSITLTNNNRGVYLSSSWVQNNVFTQLSAEGNDYGIYLSSGTQNNSFNGGATSSSSYDTYCESETPDNFNAGLTFSSNYQCKFKLSSNITTCGYITESGEYSILNDIDATSYGDDCIVISADNVILNGNDNTITGDSNFNCIDTGDEIYNGLEIHNLEISGFNDGITLLTSSSSIYSNSISGGSDFGIYLDGDNNNVYDNTINDQGSSSGVYGISIDGSGNNIHDNTLSGIDAGRNPITITGNNNIINLNTISDCAVGIALYGSSNNVTSNTLSHLTYDGSYDYGAIFSAGGTSGNLIRGNTLTDVQKGIVLSSDDNNNIIQSNSVSGAIVGMLIQGSGNQLTGNNVSDATEFGVYNSGGNNYTNTTILRSAVSFLNAGSGTNISGLWISHGTGLDTGFSNGADSTNLDNFQIQNISKGIYWNSGNSGSIQNGIIRNSSTYGILFNGGANNVFRNTNISNSSTQDIYHESSANAINNSFINCTYNISKESVSAGSQLIRKWYLDLGAADSLGVLSGVNITGRNSSQDIQFSELSGANGRISTQEMIEYINTAGERSYYTNYNLTATKAGYTTNVTSLNLTNNFNLNLSIEDTTAPLINYTSDTPESNEIVQNNFSVYVSVNEDNFQNITFRLYNSSNSPLNSTTYTSRQYNISWNLSAGDYRYNVTTCDALRCNSTATRNISVLRSCMEQCSEGSDCQITSNCTLNSGLCNDEICDFGAFRINATVRTLYQTGANSLNANDLYLNVSNITFVSQSAPHFIFSGKDTVSGTGGTGGILTIRVPNLLNTTGARLTGVGGNGTISGGAGGQVVLYYRGLIGFIDPNGDEGIVADTLTSGGIGEENGEDGGIVFYRDELCTKNVLERDVDINGDGVVNINDAQLIDEEYNLNSTRTGFNSTHDISCDNKTNIIEMSRIGWQYTRGNPNLIS
jgi:hypothetical protein